MDKLASTDFPALAIRPPESPLEQVAKAQQVVMGRQQIQAQQQQFADQQALTKAMTSWDGSAETPFSAGSSLSQLVLKNGGSGQAAFAAQQAILATREKASDIAKNDSITNQNNVDTHTKQYDAYRGRIMTVMGIDDPAQRQAAWDAEISKEEAAGTIQPGQMSHTYPGDGPALALANSYALGSTLVKEQQEKQRIALDAWKPAGGALQNVVTGETIGGLNPAKIAQLNNALQARWQVLHPGEALPDHFKLAPNATPTDFASIDKVLEATEHATGTVAQQQTTNAIRAQTAEMVRDKQDLKPVMGTDPKTGQTVLVPFRQAQGLQGAIQAPEDTVNKAFSARHWLTLASRPGDPNGSPDQMSIAQLIDKLDANGKLGVVASRWNEFLAGKYGAGDPDVAALRTKMGLSTTLLMQAHVGNRGGPAMLEHFEDLANQKKLDGPTLRSAFNSEISYVRDRAMDPNPPDYSKGTTGKAGSSGVSVATPAGATGKARGSDNKWHYHDAQGNDLGVVP